VVLVTEDYKSRYLYRTAPLPSVKRLRIIPNGVDLRLFHPKGNSGVAEVEKVSIGMGSRLTATKDVATLIRVMAIPSTKHADSTQVRLRIAGDGAELSPLEALVDELALHDTVQFSGTLDEGGVANFLRGLDIYAHSTKGETLSTAILQAYATDLPVVASDVEGVHNLVRDGVDGLIVSGQDPFALAQAVSGLMADPRRRTVLGSAARARAEAEFGVPQMADRYLDAFAQIDPADPWRAAS
jgi:glycosyltransferase involved in cell wall biosynthesis